MKNSTGKFSDGRKVTGIEFIDDQVAMVTTNDSRVRFINILTGQIVYKIKGHKNESYHVRASITDCKDQVVCGSEDGSLYLWDLLPASFLNPDKPS